MSETYDKKSIRYAINDKMRALDNFGICDRHDATMIAKLKQAIAEKPNKNPREVLDYFCRPMIQDKINSWV